MNLQTKYVQLGDENRLNHEFVNHVFIAAFKDQ